MIAVFDGHNDALTRPDAAGFVGGRPDGHLDLARMAAGGMRGGIFAVFTPTPGEGEPRLVERHDGVREYELSAPVDHEHAAAFAAAAAGRMLALERAGHLRLARRIDDVEAARHGAGPPVAVLHLEGAEAIDAELEALDLWYAAGLRSLGPVWSRPNAFGHGVPFVSPSSPDTGPGLSDAGRGLVARCAELGIVVDLSHLNEAGFWDVAEIGAGPLVASHSGVHALCPTSRNLTDRQIDAIGASDGLVGIVFAPEFLRADFQDDAAGTSAQLIAVHARYVADRIGPDHVALGSDFDGAGVPGDVGDAAGLPRVLAALEDAGFSSAEVEAIAWGNWTRVLRAWWR